MLFNLSSIRQQVAQLSSAGIRNNTNGVWDFDNTTIPTLNQINNFINQTIMENTSSWDYQFLETTKSFPFYHTISGVQGLYLSGISLNSGLPMSTNLIPWPFDVLNYTQTADPQLSYLANNYSGINFASNDPNGIYTTGISNFGIPGYNYSLNTLGFNYQLSNDVDKIITVALQNNTLANQGGIGTAIVLKEMDWHDIMLNFPQGIAVTSGTPVAYSEFPGLGPNNNKVITFWPCPLSGYIGSNFIVHYKKRHVDLIQDTDTQVVIPEQWQNICIFGALEKTFDLLDSPKASLYQQRKDELIKKMKLWDANQPNRLPKWTDFRYNSTSNGAYINQSFVFIPSSR